MNELSPATSAHTELLDAEEKGQVCTEAPVRYGEEKLICSPARGANRPGPGSGALSGIPETQRQAERWDATRDRYALFGLCDRCAAQAAYGHADGFSEVHPPCQGCAELVTALPVSRPNGWRSFTRGDGPVQRWPSAALSA